MPPKDYDNMQEGGWTHEYREDDGHYTKGVETPNERKRLNKPVIQTEAVGADEWAINMNREVFGV